MGYMPYLDVVAIFAWFAICFLQSGIDKVVNFDGNLTWLESHFGETFLARHVRHLLGMLTVLELAAGVGSVVGIVFVLMSQRWDITVVASSLNCVTLLSLFLGQRIAKDYGGAASLVPYFILAVWALAACLYAHNYPFWAGAERQQPFSFSR